MRIETPLPFALRSANSWLWPGPDPVLVDTGLGDAPAWATLHAALKTAQADAARLTVVLTHGHPDHAGNAARLVELGATVTAMEAEAPIVARNRATQRDRHAAIGDALRRHGVPASVVEAVRQRGSHYDSFAHDTPMRGLRHGQRIPLGSGEAVVQAAPGHTPGSLLLALDSNELITGDTLLEHITSNAIEVAESDRGRYATYVRTLEGLRRFVGCTALPGHHAPFVLTDALLDHHLAKHEARSRKVLAALDPPRTAWELLPRVLPHLAEDQTFLGLCEVIGHLHRLEEKGLAVPLEGVPTRFGALPPR